MPQIIIDFNKLKTAGKFLTYSLLVALPLTFHPKVLAQEVIPLKPIISQPANSSKDAVVKKLVGQWEAKDASGPNVNFMFTADGTMFLIMVVGDKSAAYPLKYQINSTQNPIYLDITLPENPKPVLTIIDFPGDGQMRMQIDGTNPGQPRPTDFSKNVSLFKKVSDNETLPQNVEVIDPKMEKSANNPQAEAETMIKSMNRAQQAYFLEFNKFAKTIQELQIGIESETENYHYRIVSSGKKNQSVVQTATAKKTNLKSYTGIVFIKKVKGETLTNTAICESVKPATKPPAIPKIPSKESPEVKCPLGSILLK
jgi:Type IV pilin-like G and H, putative